MCMWDGDRVFFFFSSRRRHTRCSRDWSSDVCSSDLISGFGVCQPGSGRRGYGLSTGTEHRENAGGGERFAREGPKRCGDAASAFGLLRREGRATRQSRDLREEGYFHGGELSEARRRDGPAVGATKGAAERLGLEFAGAD